MANTTTNGEKVMDLRRRHMIELSFDVAVLMKWHQGQQKYGPEFIGDPLIHLYDELVDAYNYTSVSEELGILTPEKAEWLREQIKELGQQVRGFHVERGITTDAIGSDE